MAKNRVLKERGKVEMSKNPLCSVCDLPILPDDDKIVLNVGQEKVDDSPWQGFQYHKECYEENE